MLHLEVMMRRDPPSLPESPSTTISHYFTLHHAHGQGPKVYDESDGSEGEDEEPSREELIELLQEAHTIMRDKKEEFKELRKRCKCLE